MVDDEPVLAAAVIEPQAYGDASIAYLDAEQVVELLDHIEDGLNHLQVRELG